MNTLPPTCPCLPRRHTARRSASRSGLSLLQCLAFVIALVGGAWLGAVYVGVDVRQLAYTALSESELLEKVPEDWRPEDPRAADASSPAELAQAVQEEFVALRHEIDTLRATHNGAAATALSQQAKSTSLAFWNRVHDAVRGEVALQIDAESAATPGNATKVAVIKGRINRFAAAAIRAIPTDGVDLAAVKLSVELADWYEQGSELYDEAVRIWESPARGQNNPAATKQWERARTQHQNEGQLLNDKISAVHNSLTRRFGDGFQQFVAL